MFALANRVQRPAVLTKNSKAPAGLPALSRRVLRVAAFREDEDHFGRKGARGRQDFGQQAKNKGSRLQRDTNNARQATKQALQRGQQRIKERVSDPRQRQSFERLAEEQSPTAYLANTLVLALFAGYTASNPLAAASLLINPAYLTSSTFGLVLPLMRILSLGYSAAAVTNYVQSNGAVEQDLDSTLHKRLNASLSTFSVAQLGLLGLCLTPLSRSILGGELGTNVLNVAGVGVLGLGVAIQLYVAGVNYAKNAPEGYSPVADAKTWLQDAANTFSNVDGANSAGYAVLTASLLAAGIGYLVLPYPTLVGVFGSSAANAGPEAIVLWQLIGAGVSMIAGPLAYQCKDGAAENELSDVRYKLMNIALLTAGVGHWLVLLPRWGSEATAGPLLPVVLGTWATAALLGSVNLLQSPNRR
eukprot:GHUV01002695.1.p1 GENE.GHUV01002695.1~~GHUV01002695.1.p1  ORF type:complete len:416 (+),score=125.33 GHUV01002695.1:151-1398(+)